MKKSIKLIATVLVFIMIAVFAKAQISVGLKGGVNISNLNGFDVANIKSNSYIGYHIGGYAAFHLGGLHIQPELIYSTQGAKYEQAGNTVNFKLNYFTIPVVLKYKLLMGVFFETGPQLGFNTSAKLESADIKNSIKSSDFSWVFGAGFQASKLGIGLRYNLGLTNVSGNTSTAVADNSFKNGLFQVSLLFKIFGK